MELIIMRHGETELNKDGRFQGCREPDLPVTPEGRTIVAANALRLPEHIMRIYVSPSRRTRETAEIVNTRFHLPLEERTELRERDFGSLTGTYKKDTDSALIQADDELRYDYRPFGGESVDDVRTRVQHFLEEIRARGEKRVLAVTHRGIIRILYSLFPDRVQDEIAPASLHFFEI
jgi:probable phosphoglycerate mutase